MTTTSVDLKSYLAQTSTRAPSLAVDAPELGAGATVGVRHLTVADRLAVQAAQDGPGTSADKLLAHLSVCLADPDGRRLFAAGDPLLLLVPAALAERCVVEAMRASTAGVADAKKVSPATPNSA